MTHSHLDPAETKRLTALGKEALENHDIVKAFDYLFLPALADERARKLFLMIPNTYVRLFLLTDAQVAMLKDYADQGEAVAQYTYGRYLYIVRPDTQWFDQVEAYFKAAEKAGVADAIAAQSLLWFEGYYGFVDIEESNKLLLKAVALNSALGSRIQLRDTLFGYGDKDADPQDVIDTVKKMFPFESNDIEKVNPMYYEILGDAYERIGNKREAGIYYNKAINMGYYEAFGGYCFLYANDLDTEEKKNSYLDLVDEACESGAPDGYVCKAVYLMGEYDEAENQPEITAQIMENLETGARLGNRIAPYFLGSAYYFGNYGFEEDNMAAWKWFSEGIKRDDAMAYVGMAQMIEEDYNPYEVDDDRAIFCRLMALRQGDSEQLSKVVKAYRKGELEEFAEEIEKYYIPRYEALPEEEREDDDEEEEEWEDEQEEETGEDTVSFDDDKYKLIAIVKTNGTADIYEFDVEEAWNELAEMVGARRLDAIRVQPLYDASKQVGLRDHITGWVDNMGLMKDLMMNPIGCKIYPGPIAGDMILTLEDAKYNPKSFESLEQLKAVLAALGAQLGDVILDDGPDDDGRYDAWS